MRHIVLLSALLVASCSISESVNPAPVDAGAGGAHAATSAAAGIGGSASATSTAASGEPIADAGQDAADQPDAAACGHCSALFAKGATLDDVPLLCADSHKIWMELITCACDTEPNPSPPAGICAGPCTYHPTPAGSWCSDLYQEPNCLACLASNPGCHGERYACINDIGGDQ